MRCDSTHSRASRPLRGLTRVGGVAALRTGHYAHRPEPLQSSHMGLHAPGDFQIRALVVSRYPCQGSNRPKTSMNRGCHRCATDVPRHSVQQFLRLLSVPQLAYLLRRQLAYNQFRQVCFSVIR